MFLKDCLIGHKDWGLFGVIHDFEFNGKSLFNFGAIITNAPKWIVPQRDVTSVSVPGRSGDLIIDNGRYKNISVPYTISTIPAFMRNTLYETVNDLKDWLSTNGTYCKLIDTYNPNYYRLARVSNINNIVNEISNVGSTTITFDCKPFMYRIDGNDLKQVTSKNFTITNPELYESEPYFKIFGSGDITVGVGNFSFMLTNVSDYLEIDCEMQDCFREYTNCNSQFTGTFPKLVSGDNKVVITGTISKTQYKGRFKRI